MGVTKWTNEALAKLTGHPAEKFRDLAPRTRHLIATGQLKPPGRFFEIRVNGKTVSGNRSKPKPLPADLQRRLERLRKFDDQEKQRAERERKRNTQARLSRLMADWRPKPTSELDSKIQQQLKTQPAKHHEFLRLMYSGWIANNEAYFGGRLELPIILVKDTSQQQAQAWCEVEKRPCVIVFGEHTVAQKPRNYCLGILAHEQIHQAIAQHAGARAAWGKNLGHHEEFARICGNISKARGWRDAYVGPVSDLYSSCHWPHHH